MHLLDRRHALAFGVGALAAAGLIGRRLEAKIAVKEVPPPKFPIEKGASLRVLRPAKFVQGDETLWVANTKRFTEATGIDVKVDSESWEDLRPKTAVAANIGSGPDIILAWQEDPHLFEQKLVPMDDLANYLGEKYGGWFPVAKHYGTNAQGRWISLPVGGAGSTMVYRKSWVKQAGFDGIPSDFPGFLELCRALQKIGRPCGFALGNAVGDGGWTDWVLWGFGSALIDEESRVIINNPKTKEALLYAKALFETFVPGTLSWLDPSNNKAFLAGEISLTTNGISIYYAAKTSKDAALQALADDIEHGDYPVGPVGYPTQGALVINAIILKSSKYPNAAKEYLRFMMEEEQYAAWMDASIGYWCHPLAAYDASPVWTADPKHAPYKNVMRKALPQSWRGRPSEAAAAAKADFVVLNMFQNVCAGKMTPEEAMADAERRAKRYFKA
ncbi:MAG: sugar ABC transporter substrate-binding protein [Geminicoccaceae bacterium]|jgi:multiple sugar transport system substrate-binding protein|nr:MAG: sugar ABC transporter substrate-binding protein [Geminicoccaceae bacterium]